MTFIPKAAPTSHGMPEPSADALAHSLQLVDRIGDEIHAAGGWIDFSRYMHLALYAPGLGYYSGGARKFGKGGDFVTAPEISPLFAQTLAQQAAQVIHQTQGSILELGAGTGILAAELLLELQSMECLPQQYCILEVSAYLQDVQRATLEQRLPPELLQRVAWLHAIPDTFKGLMLGNEVLDALPVHVLRQAETGIAEMGVTIGDSGFAWQEQALTSGQLYDFASAMDFPPGYTTEVCPAAHALIASLASSLEAGVILMIDYGFPRSEYYHPQRSEGSLMCHYRHYAHGDPFLYPGLQDITAHVDFTVIAQAGVESGMELLGYVGQAQFLINCGITQVLTRVSPADVSAYIPLASQAQKLLSPAEMGELFKVIALGKHFTEPLIGFVQGDKSHTL